MALPFLNFPSFVSHKPSLRHYPPIAAAEKKIGSTKEVQIDHSPFLKIYTDGTIERLLISPNVPPSPEDSTTGVASKDIAISPSLSARIYRPKLTHPTQKLPVVFYSRGGYFCLGSSFSLLEYRYTTRLTAASGALVLSVEFRSAPEHPLPAAYEDSWEALKWLCSHAVAGTHVDRDEWIADHGDFSRLFLVGDSSGGNIAHNLAMRAGSEPLPGDARIIGAIISDPYFLGSDPIGNEPKEDREKILLYRNWMLVYPSAAGGIDNPLINPFADGAPCLSGLGCSNILVCVSEKDTAAARSKLYAEKLKESGWNGGVEVVEIAGEEHCFHVFFPETENAKIQIKRMGAFISQFD